MVFKRLDDAYRPSVRGWQKYKVRETSEAIVGAITGSLTVPRTLLLGRYDTEGRFQYVGRTTTLAQAAGAAVATPHVCTAPAPTSPPPTSPPCSAPVLIRPPVKAGAEGERRLLLGGGVR
ncbi:hypothetical protein [Streptomyces graminofaciens]|uniref:hypothetical protein n=1 Tax=Streptomyces graminofaciens TaxID=68212 RepID=UPI0025725604|nr:hypothetical protein [Streptomyces graminofaciens]